MTCGKKVLSCVVLLVFANIFVPKHFGIATPIAIAIVVNVPVTPFLYHKD